MERTAIVTGATSGIGREVARQLAADRYRVVLACRNVEAAHHVRKDLLATDPGAEIEVGPRLDVSTADGVASFVAEFGDRPVSVLVNNAGANHQRDEYSDDGIPLTMQVNYVGPYLITRLLLENLRKAPERAKVVNVASVMHRFGRKIAAETALNDGMVGDYCQSKLALVMFSHEFHRRYGKVIDCCSVDPGAVNTKIFDIPQFDIPMLKWVIQKFFATPEDSARTIVHAVEVASHPHTDASPFFARGIFTFAPLLWYQGYSSSLVGQCLFAMVFTSMSLLSLFDYPIRNTFGRRLLNDTRSVTSVTHALDVRACQHLWTETEQRFAHFLRENTRRP